MNKFIPWQKTRSISGVYLAIPRNQKIPVSLLIASSLFLLNALSSILNVCLIGRLIFEVGFPQSGGMYILIALSFSCACILFWFLLSRGLRHCSRGWRLCTLILIWLSLIGGVVQIIQSFITHKLPHHETPLEFWGGMGLSYLLLIWQYWVLTRPHIRSLFYPNAEGKVMS